MKTKTMEEKKFNTLLKGKIIKSCRYLSKEECDAMGWWKSPLVIDFTDGTCIFSQSDDEGNNGGAYCFYNYNTKTEKIIYTI